MRAASAIVLTAVAAVVLATPLPAAACPVCWGAADSPMAAGMNNGIFFLLAVVGMVQLGFVALFVSFRRRAKHYQERRDSLELINGGLR